MIFPTFLRFSALYCVLQLIIRLLLATSLTDEPTAQAADLIAALIFGLLHDMVIAAMLLAPLALLICVRPTATPIRGVLIGSWLVMVILVSMVATIGDVFFWHEFESRPNRLVFHYLKYPVEVTAFLEEQFYLSIILFPFCMLVWFGYRGIKPWADNLKNASPSTKERGILVTIGSICIIGGFLFIQHGPFAYSSSRHVNAIASNSYLAVFHSATVKAESWQGSYPIMKDGQAQEILKNHFPNPPVASPEQTDPSLIGIKHVIFIIEESFAGNNWQDLSKRQRYMPNLEKWRQKSVYFDRVYATGTRTTRGMEALFHGFPPLPGIALTQRPGYQNLPSLPRVMKAAGFSTTFVYGGWPGFSDFAEYWQSIGFDKIITKYDFDNRWFETSWGVADEILFDRLLREMDRQTSTNEKVFVSTLTVSNHRPFDIPPGRLTEPVKNRSLESGVAYADWALGRFLEEAKTRQWFKDTLIVISADHGPRPTGNALVPASSFRVPVLMISDHLKSKTVTSLGSTMDIPRTLINLLGISGAENFWGDNLLKQKDGYALVEHDYHVGLFTGSGLTVLVREGDPSQWLFDDQGILWPDEINQDQVDLATAIFQTAHKEFYSNPPTKFFTSGR
jgi:phosphoglycerol transferase MdoB-like AlkP superfamily enzyme